MSDGNKCCGTVTGCGGGGDSALAAAPGATLAEPLIPQRLYLREGTCCGHGEVGPTFTLVELREPVPPVGETLVVHVYERRSVLTLRREVPTERTEVAIVQQPGE